MSRIVVIAEHANGTLRKVVGEVASEAARLAKESSAELVAVALGEGAEDAVKALGRFGITRGLAITGDSANEASGEAHAAALAAAIQPLDASAVLFGATSWGRDLLGRVAVHLGVSPASDCVGLEWNGGSVIAKRPVYAGKALLRVESTSGPTVASLRPNVFVADASGSADVAVEVVAAPAAPERQAVVVSRSAPSGGTVDLQEAEVVVAGGRGLKDPETFAKLLEPLAESLGAALGASRAVVDAGWRPHSEQVGQTGKTVAPKLYFACGISGAIQHLAGMRTSGTIVAINKDADAPIFKVADFGIVGDAEQILPVLTEQVKALKAE